MRTTLLALAFAALPCLALAGPPATGSKYLFHDPIYRSTVFCDTLEQIQAIADASQPEATFRELVNTVNAMNEPTCSAMTRVGTVVEVIPLGVMRRDGLTFKAWAVETEVGQHRGYALYLERFEMVIA